jgi:hypothetical protein
MAVDRIGLKEKREMLAMRKFLVRRLQMLQLMYKNHKMMKMEITTTKLLIIITTTMSWMPIFLTTMFFHKKILSLVHNNCHPNQRLKITTLKSHNTILSTMKNRPFPITMKILPI